MPTDNSRSNKAVPTSRIRRFGKLSKMAASVAGGMLAEGTRQLSTGKRPKVKDMLLTPGNAKRVVKQLSEMRGAAMKLGQILSMDSGELLPKELADILSKLRNLATAMPAAQLNEALIQAYGPNWPAQFASFDDKPLATASIGQVHRATSLTGKDLVLKIQYPGVSQSIDSDMDNLATLLKRTGLIPKSIDIGPLLEEAKQQFKQEANYLQEAKFHQRFYDALDHDGRFEIPRLEHDLVRGNVLAMSFVSGQSVESAADLDQDSRNAIMTTLFDLTFAELFELQLIQSDPNFANYLYNHDNGKIVLLDFGASRPYSKRFANNYRALAKAGINEDTATLSTAAAKIGYPVGDENTDYRQLIEQVFMLILEPLRTDETFDFASTDIPERLRALGEDAQNFEEIWEAPPVDAIFLHRKIVGMCLLAKRLEAKVNLFQLATKYL